VATRRILALNVGSSSLRMDVWPVPGTSAAMLVTAQGIGTRQGVIIEETRGDEPAALPDHSAALESLLARLPALLGVDAAGHRIVHGGPTYRDPVWVDETVLATLDTVAPLVPLHVPPALQVIRDLMLRLPHIPQAVVFDTAFHATLPPRAFHYAVPADWRTRGVRRYGFHGIACADAVYQLGPQLQERAVLLHLGAGCSATALLHGQSVDTTMGLTPLQGLVMGTRAGDLDPGILVHLQREHGVPLDRLDRALNHECGLLGLSGLSADMKTLLGNLEAPQVALAVDVFCYQAAKAAAAMAVALGGCDQIIFSGGIGEHAALVRDRICRHLEFLGVHLDGEANLGNAPVVSAAQSAVSVHVVRVDEGRQIAHAVGRLMRGRPPVR
jgi:acetate kinase